MRLVNGNETLHKDKTQPAATFVHFGLTFCVVAYPKFLFVVPLKETSA